MFTNLPDDLQKVIAAYLDNFSLCFFALTSQRSLKNVQSQLIRQKALSRISLTAHKASTICHTSNTLFGSGHLGFKGRNNYTTLTLLGKLPSGTIQQVVTALYYTMVLTDQGLFGCGDNFYGQLGLGHMNQCTTLTPMPLPELSGTIQQVVAANQHTVVLTDRGLFVCGNNSNGQLGLGHTNKCMTLTPLKNLPSALRELQAQYLQLDKLITLSEAKDLVSQQAESFRFHQGFN